MTKIGVIGVGQMGSAIIKGLKKDATNKIIGENPVPFLASRVDIDQPQLISDQF